MQPASCSDNNFLVRKDCSPHLWQQQASAKCFEGGATQILHARSNHWVCIQVNDDKSLVEVYDSKYKSLPVVAVDQILQLIQSEQDAVTINCKTMQVQEGDDACGTFAIAVATSLWHGQNPISKVWK